MKWSTNSYSHSATTAAGNQKRHYTMSLNKLKAKAATNKCDKDCNLMNLSYVLVTILPIFV